MKKKIAIATTIVLVIVIACVGGYLVLFGKVPYEIVTSLPEESHMEYVQRERDTPITIAVEEEYIAVLPPYGYKVEFIDVVRDVGITMLYNLIELEDPDGEAPLFCVKVWNPLEGPLGATCLNFDSLPINQDRS